MSPRITRIDLLPTDDVATENQREDVDILIFWEPPKNLFMYMCVLLNIFLLIADYNDKQKGMLE